MRDRSAYLLPGLLVFSAFVELTFVSAAAASGLLAPSAGAADAAAGGATIAQPLSPLGAQFSNPAGLAFFQERAMGLGLGLAYGQGEVTAEAAGPYHADNEVLVPFLQTFLVVPRGRWTFAMSTMGTSGARFDYGARPEVGVGDGFFSESSVLGAPIGASYRVSDTLWLGGQIIPLYGSTHLRFSREVSELGGQTMPFRFTVSGFGVQGMLGVTWKPGEDWTLGMAYRPPGRIWASGDTAWLGGEQDVDLELEAPQEVTLGVTWQMMPKLSVSYGGRFIDTSVLATSTIRFENTPSANAPFLAYARDEWRHALGLDYDWSESLSILGGLSWANGIVGDRGVSPMSYDSDNDLRLSVGTHWQGETYVFAAGFAYVLGSDRQIEPEEARVMPGNYDSKPAYVLSMTVTRKF